MAQKTRIGLQIFTIEDTDDSIVNAGAQWLDGVTISGDGNELIFANGSGICLTAPDGGEWRLSVDNAGVLITTEVV